MNKLSQIANWKKEPPRPSPRAGPRDAEEPQVETYIAQRYIDNPYLIGGRAGVFCVTIILASQCPQMYVDTSFATGKKFDIRLYALVTSYSPLTVYVHRIGFCRFCKKALARALTHRKDNTTSLANYQYSLAKDSISNMYIHATNVAIQKTAPEYNGDKGCKWQLRNLRMYLAGRHGEDVADRVFTDMEALIVRSLMSVQKVMINDKHCFEL